MKSKPPPTIITTITNLYFYYHVFFTIILTISNISFVTAKMRNHRPIVLLPSFIPTSRSASSPKSRYLNRLGSRISKSGNYEESGSGSGSGSGYSSTTKELSSILPPLPTLSNDNDDISNADDDADDADANDDDDKNTKSNVVSMDPSKNNNQQQQQQQRSSRFSGSITRINRSSRSSDGSRSIPSIPTNHENKSSENSNFNSNNSNSNNSNNSNTNLSTFKLTLQKMSLPLDIQQSILSSVKSIGFTSSNEMITFSENFSQEPETLGRILMDDFGLPALEAHRLRAALLKLVLFDREEDKNNNNDNANGEVEDKDENENNIPSSTTTTTTTSYKTPSKKLKTRKRKAFTYVRSDNNNNNGNLSTTDLKTISKLIHERATLRSNFEYQKSDVVQQQLLQTYKIIMDDVHLTWYIDNDQYVKSSRTGVLGNMNVTDVEIRAIQKKLEQRAELRRDGDYKAADVILADLSDTFNVLVDDGTKEWWKIGRVTAASKKMGFTDTVKDCDNMEEVVVLPPVVDDDGSSSGTDEEEQRIRAILKIVDMDIADSDDDDDDDYDPYD